MFKRFIAFLVCCTFITSYYQPVFAQNFSVNQLPVPGTMVGISTPFSPLALKGLIVNPRKPLEFQFIVDTGRGPQDIASVKDQASQLVKYFLAGLTIPEGDLWVNLSPYEKNRMVPVALGQTDLGRDLLAQDYILKQLTASLIYPEKDLGKEFWSRVYAKAQEQFGTTNVPVNTFNKVWILPNQAQVFENGNAAYVTKATLKVMLDQDYLALSKHQGQQGNVPVSRNPSNALASQIVREIVLPEIEKEVNTGKNFAPLRQIYQALILAKWYKETIQNSLIDAVYTNKKKIAGVNLDDPAVKEQIYQRYLQAYKKGAFNYIKEDSSPDGQLIPRKYFSGGTNFNEIDVRRTKSKAMLSVVRGVFLLVVVGLSAAIAQSNPPHKTIAYEIPQRSMPADAAMSDNPLNKSMPRFWYTLLIVYNLMKLGTSQYLEAVRFLSKRKSPELIEILKGKLLNDSNSKVRLASAITLGEYGDPELLSTLLKGLDDANYDVKIEILRALGKLKDPRAIQPIIATFNASLEYLLEDLKQRYGGFGGDVSLEENVMSMSILALGQIGGEAAEEFIAEKLDQNRENFLINRSYGLKTFFLEAACLRALIRLDSPIVYQYLSSQETYENISLPIDEESLNLLHKKMGYEVTRYSRANLFSGYENRGEAGGYYIDLKNTYKGRISHLRFEYSASDKIDPEEQTFVWPSTEKYDEAGTHFKVEYAHRISIDKPLSQVEVPDQEPVLVRQPGNGGIDLNQIHVNHAGKPEAMQFDQAQLNELMQGGFEGFTPVIINITPIQSPLSLLGVGPSEEESLAKV